MLDTPMQADHVVLLRFFGLVRRSAVGRPFLQVQPPSRVDITMVKNLFVEWRLQQHAALYRMHRNSFLLLVAALRAHTHTL